MLSRRGATKPHGQREQHQPVKFSSSAQIMCLFIAIPIPAFPCTGFPTGGEGRTTRHWRIGARKLNQCPRRRECATESPEVKVTNVLRPVGQGPSGRGHWIPGLARSGHGIFVRSGSRILRGAEIKKPHGSAAFLYWVLVETEARRISLRAGLDSFFNLLFLLSPCIAPWSL